MLSYDEMLDSPRRSLLRQAYLLTGDPDRAHRLTERALDAGHRELHRLGPDGAAELARAELVRAFAAEPPLRAPVPTGPALQPDVAVWQALRRLSPRRCAVVVLRYDEGLTEEQAAARLGTSAQAVRADADAAMLTLRTALPRGEDPFVRIAEALHAAGRGWSDYTEPAPGRVAEVLAAPAPRPPAPAQDGSPRSRRPAALAALAVAGVLLAAVVVVPRLGGDDPADPAPAAVAGPAGAGAPVRGAPRRSVPTATVDRGLLNWPARGALAEDDALVAAATAAWRAKVPAAEAPATGTTVLWAGRLDGRVSVVLQALDRGRHPRIAQLTGPSAARLTTVSAEPLHAGTTVLSLLPVQGPGGPVRVLVSPEAQVADGLLAGNPKDGSPLRRMPVGDDGVSGVLPSPPGKPTCSRVVLLGLDSVGGPATGRNLLYSGVVAANMLGGMPMDVEVGSATLAAAAAEPGTGWFADGARLAPKVPGKGTLTVATLGPRIAATALPDGRSVSSRAYELRRGDRRWLGSVVDLDGRPLCTAVLPVGTARPGPAGWVLRCPVPGGTAGLLHVVGAPGTGSVDVDLDPTPAPPGQRPYAGTARRPADVPAEEAFAVLQVVPSGFPCGPGSVRVHRGDEVAAVQLPVYTP